MLPMPRRVHSQISSPLATRMQYGVMAYTYKGVPALKSPFDMAIYTQLLYEMRPRTILEFGSNRGGSALWLADTAQMLGLDAAIYSFDINQVTDLRDPRIDFRFCDVSDVSAHISDAFVQALARPILVIEDASHMYQHVLNVLNFFDRWSQPGDYMIVEDGVISIVDAEDQYEGGPYQALHDFLDRQPEGRYEIDRARCDFYGENVTWNPDGYIKRTDPSSYKRKTVEQIVLTDVKALEGKCWWVALPAHWPEGDSVAQPAASTVRLFEDDRLIGPAHSAHIDIRMRGAGAYSHWGRTLYFSTPDGSSPLENGRTYRVEITLGGSGG
jgi:cephalosporin hydroxylase